ncbi:major capsid protein [Corynebacterium phage Colleen]|uniref:Major capsid protein n=4 Tax=root TaxID=1 RepID=W5XY28_9CORY|nr:major capsid protein [Corynebacterium vitaeruminis]YP_009626521.1 major head protein [Corynebacterium phage Poushou]AWY06457.1 major capsid protein [Corynebacterium phage TouchMeNot]QFG14758.1 major capsid protein [Corynebacterium phage Colleen]UVT31895.1 major capsid protein [Corynebacterium phage Arianna]AHI21599.1 hypothetical protein B843_01015 [Corynebacterium vitaeruminis DSM 20294]ASJ78968.1 major capsid protein [Corynebacterium phage Poushou]
MLNTGFFPGEAPKVTADGITVSLMLKEPTRIARYISDITALGMFTDRIFAHGTAEGGAILYDVATKNAMLADDHMGIIAPGGNYPIVDASDGEPKVTKTKKLGGKFGITDEAASRNDMAYMQRRAQRVANTMVYDTDSQGLAAITAALAEYDSDIIKVESGGWESINKTAKSAQTAEKSIRADINKALAEGQKTLMGYQYDVLVLHTDDKLQYDNAFEDDVKAAALAASKGIEIIGSPLATKGEGWLIASNSVGTMGVESPVTSTPYRDEDHDLTWVKTRAIMAHAITDPLAVIRIQNLGA